MSFSSAFTPGDSRRFCGPPGATSYSNFVDKSTKKGVKGRKGAKKSAASNDKLKHRDICEYGANKKDARTLYFA